MAAAASAAAGVVEVAAALFKAWIAVAAPLEHRVHGEALAGEAVVVDEVAVEEVAVVEGDVDK